MDSINAIIGNESYQDWLSVLKGARNGLVYGAKIRFPHALVMTALFHKGTLQEKIKFIFSATKTHSLNLAKFVSFYKLLMVLQKKFNGGKERSADSFFAGLIGGYVIFGDRNAVNEQIVLYVASRVVASFLPRTTPTPTYTPTSPAPDKIRAVPPRQVQFSIFAALAWAFVMWTFKRRPETLQGGLVNSMQYLYRDSDKWDNLKTLLWHNK